MSLYKSDAAEPSSSNLDVIVRLHRSDRGAELRRCIFSLVCQRYRPLNIHLATQRFSAADLQEVRECLRPVLEIDPDIGFVIHNFDKPEPHDARSALINMALRQLHGRYLAFLDYDDLIYSRAYCRLISDLNRTRSLVAFGKILIKNIDLFQDALICDAQRDVFSGKNVLDLFYANFCPIHSFVIDRSKAKETLLWFDEGMNKNEDYDFLIRLCADGISSFDSIEVPVGEYHTKNDGSNTILVPSSSTEEAVRSWATAEELVEKRRKEVLISREVQEALGARSFNKDQTVRRMLDWVMGRKGDGGATLPN